MFKERTPLAPLAKGGRVSFPLALPSKGRVSFPLAISNKGIVSIIASC